MQKFFATIGLVSMLLTNLGAGGVFTAVHSLNSATIANAAGPIDISVSASGPSNAAPGDTVTYTYGVMQNDTGVATSTQLTQTVPSGYTFVSATGASCSGTSTVTCTGITDIPQNQTRNVAITYDTDGVVCGTTVTVAGATASASETDTNPGNETANQLSTTFGACEADLEASISGTSGNVDRNDPVSYIVSAKNNGPSTATTVVVTTPKPSEVDFDSGGSSGTCSEVSGNIECTIASIASGVTENFTVAFTVKSDATCGSDFTASTSVSSAVPDSNGGNDSATASQVDIVCTDADLSIDKTGPATTAPGGTLVYNFTASNAGPATANAVTISDPIPSGLTFNTGSSGCSDNGTTVTCNNITLTSGGSTSVSITYDVPNNAVCGDTIQEIASVATSSIDPVSANNTDSAQVVTIDCSNNTADLAVTKTGPASAEPNNTLTYSFSITNNGPHTANDVTLSDPIPTGFTLNTASTGCSDNGGDILCSGITLASGQTTILTITYDVPSNAICGSTVQEAATVATSTNDPTSSNNTSQAQSVTIDCANQPADLSLTKSNVASVYNQGDPLSYDIVVTNGGPGVANSVTVTDIIPTGLDFDSGNSDSRCVENAGEVLCDNTTLTNGQSTTFTIAFTVEAGAACGSSISNTATVSTSSTDPVSSNNSATTNAFTVNCPVVEADLSIVYLFATSGNVQKGDTVTYTLDVANTGPATANSVIAAMDVPAGLEYKPNLSDGRCVLGSSVLCNNTTLVSGQNTEFILVFKVRNDATCQSTTNGSASVSSSTTDPNSANNTANSASITVDCTSNTADLSLTKVANQSTVVRGNIVSYTLTATNNGPATANTVTFTDAIPNLPHSTQAVQVPLVFSSGGSSTNCAQVGDNIVCNNITLANGQSASVTVAFTVPSSVQCSSSIANSASVSTSTTDPDSGNNTDSAAGVTVNCPPQSADHVVAMMGPMPNFVTPGHTLVYMVQVYNAGPDPSADFTVDIAAPPGFTFDQNPAFTNGICTANGSGARCVKPDGLAIAQLYSFHVGFLETNAVCFSTVTTHAVGTSTTPDPNTANNTTMNVPTIVQCPLSVLEITKAGPATALRGSEIDYNITVTNTSNSVTAIDATIIDLLPNTVEFVQVGSSNDCHPGIDDSAWCDPVTMAPGEVRNVTIRVRIKDTVLCNSSIGNTVDVWAQNTDPNWSNHVVTTVICPSVTFAISKDDGRTTVQRGETLTYQIPVRNTSFVPASNVSVSDVLPQFVTFIGASNGGAISNNQVTWTGLNFAAGELKTLTLTVTVDANAPHNYQLLNEACVVGGPCDTDITTVDVPPPTLRISKTDHETSAVPGQRLTYAIAVTNSSPVIASNFTVRDSLPLHVIFVSATAGGTNNNSVVTWSNQSLAAGGTAIFHVDVDVSPNAPDGIVLDNLAQVLEFDISAEDRTTIHTPVVTGCIDVTKRTFDTQNNPITPVPQFTFLLDGVGPGAQNPGSGVTGFINVPVGQHTVSEILPQNWLQTSLVPSGGIVNVLPGFPCAQVTLENTQNILLPVLSISKTDNETVASPGQRLTYTIAVSNSSPHIANNITLKDVLPGNVTFVSANNGGVFTANEIHWTGVTIQPNSGVSFQVVVDVNSGTQDGYVLLNHAEVPAFAIFAQDTTTISNAPLGCIDIIKEVFDEQGQLFTPVPTNFTFRLDGGNQTVSTNSLGIARFNNVQVGNRIVTESFTSSWVQLSATPPGGQVQVPAGPNCATVLFKNQLFTQTPVFSITKTDGKTTATPTEALTYVITVTNQSNVSASNVFVTDTLPSGITLQSATPNATLNGAVLTFDPLAINANQSQTLTVVARINSGTTLGTVLTNTAHVIGGPTASDTTLVDGSPILSISKTDNKSTANPGERLTYSIAVTNSSPTIAASNVTVVDTLPALTTFVSAANGGVYNSTTRQITWTNVSVSTVSTTVLSVTADVSTTATNGSVITNSVQVNNAASAQDSTTVVVGTADPNNVTIDLKDDRDPVRPSDSFCYTITVTNLNAAVLNNQTVTQTLDGKTAFQSASDGGTNNSSLITWNNITLPANGNKVLTSCVRVQGNALDNDILNSQAIINTKSDPESTRVDEDGDGGGGDEECSISSITDNPDPAQRGETLTYNIRIRNESNNNKDVDVIAFFDNDVSFLSASRSGDDNGREVEWENIRLDSNESETLRLSVRVLQSANDGDTIRLRVRCEDDEESESTRVTGGGDEEPPAVSGDVRLSVDKRANRQEANPGDTVIYTITVRNLTNRAANNVSIEDRFSQGSIAIEDAGGGRVVGNGIDWEIPILGANDTRVFSYRTRIGSDMRHGQIVRNTVTVRSPDADRPATDVEDVRILTELPQTGLGGFIGGGTSGTLSPSHGITSQTGAMTMFILWTSIISIGLTAGSVLGRRMFI